MISFIQSAFVVILLVNFASLVNAIENIQDNLNPTSNPSIKNETFTDNAIHTMNEINKFRGWHGVSNLTKNYDISEVVKRVLHEQDRKKNVQFLYFTNSHLFMGQLQTKSFVSKIVYEWYFGCRQFYDFKNPHLSYENRPFAAIVYKNADKIGCTEINARGGIYLGCGIHMNDNFDKDFKDNILPIKN
uniref:SCP domain-containing protein n=1 Tax=Parastrongyloides trichosuri TaxID=131310 RepID=A0A0N5A138_PARTI